MLEEISATRIRATDSVLVTFGTRHTLGDTVSQSRGIGAARRWIYSTLTGYAGQCQGCLRVEYDSTTMPVKYDSLGQPAHLVNVLAWFPGRDTTHLIVFGGHYDSAALGLDPINGELEAPGANDNGSGTAAVLEVARVLTKHYPQGFRCTVLFALFAGEEMGLLGSKHLSKRLQEAGYRIPAILVDDKVGNIVAQDGRVDSTSVRIFTVDPDTGRSRELGRYVQAVSAVYQPSFRVLHVFRRDRIGRGSDHLPFQQTGIPATRFTERLEDTRHEHLPTDRFEYVNHDYVTKVARLNAAVVGTLALAPLSPEGAVAVRDDSSGGQHWRVHWGAVAGAASYEMLLRWTSSPNWESLIKVGPDTTYLLTQQLDDAWAGVRAVSADGQRSPISTVCFARPNGKCQ